MSKNRRQANQMLNAYTQLHYNRKCEMIAKNVFLLDKFPKELNVRYINKVLYQYGGIAFFYEDVLKEYKAMPFEIVGPRDDQDQPRNIRVHSLNGQYSRLLTKDEYVIMWDNTEERSIVADILMYAERLAKFTRTVDINIAQQKTPRIIKCQNGKEVTLRKAIADVDSYEDLITTYSELNVDDITTVLAPAPYVATDVNQDKDKCWAEFLGFVGVSNISVQKKERQIRDEIVALNGGTLASRFSRFEPRKEAIDEINAKWGLNCSVKYYDGEPDMKEPELDYDSEDESGEEE